MQDPRVFLMPKARRLAPVVGPLVGHAYDQYRAPSWPTQTRGPGLAGLVPARMPPRLPRNLLR
jgi:hypothetical protein